MNTCPVFRRSGGHSYATHVPGPIGSILAPLREPELHRSLPHACTLCGSCTAVCPVGIDLHEQLLTLRSRQIEGKSSEGGSPVGRWLGALSSWLSSRPGLVARLGHVGRWLGRHVPGVLGLGPGGRWVASRALPPMPRRSFQQQYAERRRAEAGLPRRSLPIAPEGP